MKYKILTYDEFENIIKKRIVYIQKPFTDFKWYGFSVTKENYIINANDIIYVDDEINMYFVDEDCIIKYIDYNTYRTSSEAREIYDLIEIKNNALTYKQIFEIASL